MSFPFLLPKISQDWTLFRIDLIISIPSPGVFCRIPGEVRGGGSGPVPGQMFGSAARHGKHGHSAMEPSMASMAHGNGSLTYEKWGVSIAILDYQRGREVSLANHCCNTWVWLRNLYKSWGLKRLNSFRIPVGWYYRGVTRHIRDW